MNISTTHSSTSSQANASGRLDYTMTNRKQESELEEMRPSKFSKVQKQELARSWSVRRERSSAQARSLSGFRSKPKLYRQTTYLGPTGVEPFSTFKWPIPADELPDDDGFPTALCRELGCWQAKPHSHDPPIASKKDYCEYNLKEIPGDKCTLNINLQNGHRSRTSLVAPLRRPPSPLVAGPACLADRILKTVPLQPCPDKHTDEAKPSDDLSFLGRSSTSTNASLLESNPSGLRDVRNALPQLLIKHDKATSSSPLVGWKVSLPIHSKHCSKRDLAETKLVDVAPSSQAELDRAL